jgi:hypothetical protein
MPTDLWAGADGRKAGWALQRDNALSLTSDPRVRPARRLARLAIVLICVGGASGLAGCSSISEKMAEKIADMPGVGLPAGVPERPATPPPYPAVHSMPPGRTNAVLTDAEQQKMEDELVAVRERQKSFAPTPALEELPPPPSPANAASRKSAPSRPASAPTSSNRSIY